MVLQIGKLESGIIVAKYSTTSSLKEFKGMMGDGEYVDITGLGIKEGDSINGTKSVDNLEGLNAIYLLLGSACNMSCRHCTQIPIKGFKCPNQKLKDNVLDFILNWNKQGGGRLYFWGGEPLLYWETIKECIRLFESKGIRNISYRIFTNGLLLTDSIADFCNKHNVWVILSYDAPNPLVARNKVPNNSNIKSFLKCDKRTVNGVFSALNNNMVESFKYLEDKFPNTEVTLGFLNVLWDIPKDLYAFKEGDIKKAVLELFEYYKLTGDRYVYRWFKTKLIREHYFNRDIFLEQPFPPCAPGRCSLSFDFNGNIMRCHNDSIKIANLSDNFIDIKNAHLDVWRSLLTDNCNNCDCLAICRSICPIALLRDDGKEFVQCSYIREFWQAIVSCKKEFEVM